MCMFKGFNDYNKTSTIATYVNYPGALCLISTTVVHVNCSIGVTLSVHQYTTVALLLSADHNLFCTQQEVT